MRIGIVVLGIIIAFSVVTCGEGPVRESATVVNFTGEVTIYAPDNSQLPLEEGLKLEPGTVVLTADNSELVFTWGQRYQVKVEENSRLVISEANWRLTPATLWGRLELTVGEVWVDLVRKADDIINFTIETPTVTAGVRGTSFRVQQEISGTSEVSVERGLVEVNSGDNQAILGAKTYIAFSPKGETEGVKAWDERISKKWKTENGEPTEHFQENKHEPPSSSGSKAGSDNSSSQSAQSSGSGSKNWRS